MTEDDKGSVAVVHCDCYIHKSTRFSINKIVEYAAARRSSLCPLLGIATMAPPVRRGGSAEHKVPHRRIDDEAVIEEHYKFNGKLGQGSFGVVIEAVNLETKERWAIKKVNKEKAGTSGITLLEREVTILKRVKHEHIIYLEEVFETPKKMYLVMELCELGELRTLLFNNGPFSEPSARHIIKSLSDAIVYLHKNGIVHRDLKLENILIAGCRKTNEEDPLYDIKLTDFGLSVVKGGVGSESMLQSSCGTPVYMAPEVIQNHDYSQQCDTWSTGVILYALLSRDFPFVSDKEERLFELIKRGEVEFTKPAWKNVSKAAKSLICSLLTTDPAHRYTASEVASHPWTLGNMDTTAPNPTNVLDMMKDFLKETTKNGDQDDFDEEFGKDCYGTDEEEVRRPESSGTTLSTGEDKSHSKMKTKSAPLTVPTGSNSHLPHRNTVAPPLQLSSDTGRRGSLPAALKTTTKKPMGASRKIYDNKSMGRSSPVSANPGSSRSIRSPAHTAGLKDHRGNGHKLTPSEYGTNNLSSGRLKATDTSGGRLYSNRPTTPGSSNHSLTYRAHSPLPVGTQSPMLNRASHDSARTGLNSANKPKKKKNSATTKR